MPAIKQFDPEITLDLMLEAFWRNGYERTSMSNLVAVTGVNRASLYATFGGKAQIFHKALRRYDSVHRDAWLTRLAAQHGSPGAIVSAFEQVFAPGGAATGCLVVNTALELAPHDDVIREVVESSFAAMHGFFGAMLTLAGRDEVERRAAALLALFLGLRVLGRGAPAQSLTPHLREQVRHLVS